MKDKAFTLSLFASDSLETNSGSPQYKQLMSKFTAYIKTGRLVPGQMLPSTRELASHLRISRKTVLRAYEELLALGVLDSARGVGTFVAGRSELNGDTAGSAGGRLLIPPYSRYARHLLASRTSIETAESALHFCAVPPEFLPTKEWTRCKLEILRYLNFTSGDCLISHHRPSNVQLRKTLVDYLAHSRNILCKAGQIRVFMSTNAPLWALARLFLDAGDSVVVENPGYPHARSIFSSHGCNVIPVSLDSEGIMVEMIENLLPTPKLIYVTPLHDPLGVELSLSRRQALLDLCRRKAILLIEDDYGNEFRQNQLSLPSLFSLDSAGQVIYLSTFWSTLYPLTTAGFVVLPAPLPEVFDRAVCLPGNSCSPYLPCLEELTLNRFISKGFFYQHLDRLKPIFKERAHGARLAIGKHLRRFAACADNNSGMHLPVRFLDTLDPLTVEACARGAQLALVGSGVFYTSDAVANEYLLPFAHLESREMAVCIEKFAQRLIDFYGIR